MSQTPFGQFVVNLQTMRMIGDALFGLPGYEGEVQNGMYEGVRTHLFQDWDAAEAWWNGEDAPESRFTVDVS